MKPVVSVVIPNYNGKDYLENCIRSLVNQDIRNFEIIVVDDNSTDTAFEDVKTIFPSGSDGIYIRYIDKKQNGGFCQTVNYGVRYARAPYIILLNNDTEADEGLVRHLYNAIRKRRNVFSVCAKMIDLKNPEIIDDAGDLYCALGWAFSPAKDKDIKKYSRSCKVFACCGGASIYRKDVFRKIGMLDEKHFAYLEDIDIGYRAKLFGYENAYEPKAVVYHAGSASSGSRHNEFKVHISSRNSIYLIYKNMPLWQIAVNFPLLLAGIIVKIIFFARKKLARAYVKGIVEGINLCIDDENCSKRVDFDSIPLKRLLHIEAELIINTFRRFVG